MISRSVGRWVLVGITVLALMVLVPGWWPSQSPPVFFRYPHISTGQVWGAGLGSAVVSGAAAGLVAAIVTWVSIRSERTNTKAAINAQKQRIDRLEAASKYQRAFERALGLIEALGDLRSDLHVSTSNQPARAASNRHLVNRATTLLAVTRAVIVQIDPLMAPALDELSRDLKQAAEDHAAAAKVGRGAVSDLHKRVVDLAEQGQDELVEWLTADPSRRTAVAVPSGAG